MDLVILFSQSSPSGSGVGVPSLEEGTPKIPSLGWKKPLVLPVSIQSEKDTSLPDSEEVLMVAVMGWCWEANNKMGKGRERHCGMVYKRQ